MRIAILSAFYPFRGGIAQSGASLYRALERQGHEVKAFTFTRQYPDLLFPGKSQYVDETDQADPIPAEQVLDTINPVTYLTGARKVLDFKPDLLIVRFWMPFFAPSFGTIAGKAKKQGIKVISILDNVKPHESRPGDTFLTQYFLKRNAGFVAMSETVGQDLLALKPDAPYTLIPHAINDHFGAKVARDKAREQLGIPKGKKVVLFFGLVRDYKGLDLLLKAFANLPEEYHLLAGGEVYGDPNTYHQLVEEHNLHEQVTLHFMYIKDQEVPLYFSAADVLALPYKSATQSGIHSIGLHFELPAIATDVGGLRELIDQYNIGLVAEKAEPEAMKAIIESFFEENMGPQLEANIRQLKAEHSWDRFAEKLLEFAQSLD